MDWIVSQQESGWTVLAFLKDKLNQLSTRHLKKEIDENRCLVNGRTERFASFKVGTGDRITLLVENSAFSAPHKRSFDAPALLFEDSYYLIYNKPAGISSEDPCLLKAVQQTHLPASLAHRLDKETTGVLLFAKTASALEAIQAIFKNRKIQKSYLAIVDGILEKASGIIDNFLGPIKRYQGQTLWGEVSANGLHAITEWKLETSGSDASLVRCFPKTGRTHQLRSHLNGISHPILGDYQYGRHFRCLYRPERYLLHAEWIAFNHPFTKEQVKVVAPIPNDFHHAITVLF